MENNVESGEKPNGLSNGVLLLIIIMFFVIGVTFMSIMAQSMKNEMDEKYCNAHPDECTKPAP